MKIMTAVMLSHSSYPLSTGAATLFAVGLLAGGTVTNESTGTIRGSKAGIFAATG